MTLAEVLIAIKELEGALKCVVCNGLMKDPQLIVKCGHNTCKQCLLKHSCPVCKTPLNSKDTLDDKLLLEFLDRLEYLKDVLKIKKALDFTTEMFKTPVVKSHKTEGPYSSTPKKGKGYFKRSPAIQSKDTSIQETPASQLPETPVSTSSKQKPETPVSTSGKQKPETPVSTSGKLQKKGNRKSSSVSSPNTSGQSPAGNLNKKNHKGETRLQVAVIKGDVAKVKELLKEGANVNTQDNNGWTPLHEASNRGFVEIAQLLLDHGALVNVPSLKDNITPLHDALLNDMMAVAILLVSRGADLHAKTSFGYTALDLCKKDGDRTILTEACSPFIEANTLIPDSKSKNTDKIVLLSSNLDEKQKEKFQKCALMLKADIVNEFKPEVSHVITSCDNQGNCNRTMKILMGILTGKWIMNFNWIEVCLEYKQKVDEEVFEVQGTRNLPNSQGPKHGRQNYEQKCPPLFDGFYFYLHGNFSSPTPAREDLCNIIHQGGGKILSREPKPDAIDTFMIPYHAAESPLEDINHVILYQEKPPRGKHVLSGHIGTTQVMWLLACISEFKIVELQQTNVVNK